MTATIPAPTRTTKAAPPARAGNRRALTATATATTIATAPIWAAARSVVRYPKTAAALSAAVAVASPVTLREVTGVFVGGCAALGMDLYWGGGHTVVRPSLQEIAKFRKRQRRIRRRWVTVMADAGMAKASVNGTPDKRRPRIVKMTSEPLGVSVVVDGSLISAGVDQFTSKLDILRAGFRCRSIKVLPSGHNVLLRLRYEEPFTRIIRFAELPAPTRVGHVVTGLDEDGDPVEKDLRLPHLMIGAQGAGKSSETWTILRGIISARIPARVRVFDPKGGQEYTEMEDIAYEYERDPTKWPTFLEHAMRAMGAKQAAMRKKGMRKLSEYTEEFPLDVMVIDELITALAFGGTRKLKINGRDVTAEDAFMMYLSTARSAGCTILASSQLAQKEVIGKIRGLFGYVTVLRIAPTEKEMLDILLGSGASKAYPAHQLSADERDAGIGYTPLRRGVVKYRSAYLSDHERHQVARGIGAWTKRLRPARTSEEAA